MTRIRGYRVSSVSRDRVFIKFSFGGAVMIMNMDFILLFLGASIIFGAVLSMFIGDES